MFEAMDTFTQQMGFSVTPIKMHDKDFIFLPKELEQQLGYENLSDTIRKSDSFVEGIEYLVLKGSNLLAIKELFKRRNSIPSLSLKYANALIVLTEPGLYTVTFLSRKPNAEKFRRWVTSEVLPTIRETGAYKLQKNESSQNFQTANKIEQNFFIEQKNAMRKIVSMLVEQEKFQQYVIETFDRIEAALAESLSPDLFDGWRKVETIIGEMTKRYNLSQKDQQKYLQELCQIHDIRLPQKQQDKNVFFTAREIAENLGLYSSTGKPHFKLVAALIRYLGLDKSKYTHQYSGVIKYHQEIIASIRNWLSKKKFPCEVKLIKQQKTQKFRIYYHPR